MRKNLTIFIGILMILSFCDAQEETETAVDEQLGNEEVVAGEEIIQEEDEKLKGKSEYRKTKMVRFKKPEGDLFLKKKFFSV